MTDSSSAEPRTSRRAVRSTRAVRGSAPHPAHRGRPPSDAEPEGRDKPHVGQRVMEQRPHERKPTEHAAARGKRPDLRDLPPPRRDTPSNVWRADPPPAARRDAAPQDDPRDRRDGPRRAHGDAPRPDRPASAAPTRPAPGARPAPRLPRRAPARSPTPRARPFRKDDRRATGCPPGPPRDDRAAATAARRAGHGHDRGAPGDTASARRSAAARRPRPELSARPQRPPALQRPARRQPRRPGRPAPRVATRRAIARAGPDDRAAAAPPRRPRRATARRPGRAAAARSSTRTRPRREDQRLSKVLAERGIASRREADDWIDAGWVKVDGEMAVLGARVFPHQVIEIDEAAKTQQAHRVTILLHKPIGYVSGQAEDGYEPAVVLVTQDNHWPEDPSRERWHPGHARGIAPAGRLDIDSTGLLVLTQDGRIARHLIGEDSDVEKEYLVRVEYPSGGQFPDSDLQRLHHGLWLDGKELKPAKVSWANEDQLRFVLREGRKRQIRRMCEAVGLVVTGLKRVRIGSVVLGKLPPGQWRYLREDERF